MQKKVVIRVDGSTKIGLGHLTRCIALAQMLQADFEIYFVSKEIPEFIIKEINDLNFDFREIKGEECFLNSLTGEEIVVLDNYFFGSDYQKKVKKIGCILVAIDDIHDKEFYADLIINHAPGVISADYLAQTYTKFALGLDYALLRPAFLAEAKKKRKIVKMETVFICFGGSDIKNLTKKCLEKVLEVASFKRIIIVVGASYSNFDHLQKITLKNQKVELHQAVKAEKMLKFMKISDLAIVPASSILLEVFCAGCKVISGMYAENQKLIFDHYRKSGIIIDAGQFETRFIKKALQQSLKNDFVQDQIIDGLSKERIKKLFENINIRLRKVNENDCKLLFEWANDKDVRKNAFNNNLIQWENHQKWFLKRIADPQSHILILERQNLPVGQIRFDREENFWKIDYSIDKNSRGFGLGRKIIELGLQRIEGNVKAWVKKDNISSCRIFESIGFEKENIEGNNEVIQYSLWK